MKKQPIFCLCLAAVTAMTGAAFPVMPAAAAAPASPIINRNGSVYSDQQSTAYAACNDVYYDAWKGVEGSYLAFDVEGSGVEIAVFYNGFQWWFW